MYITYETKEDQKLKEISETGGIRLGVLMQFYDMNDFELDELKEKFDEAYQDKYTDLSAWAEDHLDNIDFFKTDYLRGIIIPESQKHIVDGHLNLIKGYFDYESYAADCVLSGDIYVIQDDEDYVYVFIEN